MTHSEQSRTKGSRPTLLYFNILTDVRLINFKKFYPKYLLATDIRSWETVSNIHNKSYTDVLKQQKHTRTLKISIKNYKNSRLFLKCLKTLWSSVQNVDIQLAEDALKKKLLPRFSSRVKSLAIDAFVPILKSIRAARNLQYITINIPTHIPVQTSYFLNLAKVFSHLPHIETCSIMNIKYTEQTLNDIVQLISTTRETINYIIEIADISFTNLLTLIPLKKRIRVHCKAPIIDCALRPDYNLSFLQRFAASLRFGLNITDISDISFLNYMPNLKYLYLSFRFKDLAPMNISELLQMIKFPRQLVSLSLELHDLQIKSSVLQKSPQISLEKFSQIERAIQSLRTEEPIRNLSREFEGLKHLESLKLSFSGDQDNQMFHLLTYTLVKSLDSLYELHVTSEISRGSNMYYELNLTYLLALLKRPEKLKQILLSVPIIGFRKIERIPALDSLEKVFLYCSKEPTNFEGYSEYAEDVFEAISKTKVREAYFSFKNDLIDEEWLKVFIEMGNFPRIEKIFLSSGLNKINVELLEAFCYFLNEKRTLTKMVLNLTRCNVLMENLKTCIKFLENAQNLNYAVIALRNGNIVNNKGLNKESRVFRV